MGDTPCVNVAPPVRPATVAMWLGGDPRPPTVVEVDALAGWTVELVKYAARAYAQCGPKGTPR